METRVNATTVGGRSSNPVGAGYLAYYIWAVDADSRKTVANSVLSGLRAGKTVDQIIADENLTLFATSKTDKDGYLASVTGDVDPSLYYNAWDADYLSVLGVVLAEKDADYVYLYAASPTASTASMTSGASPSKYLRDNTGKESYGINGWYALSAPEPTSGLLLLLGIAGLALKRKQK